MVDDVADQWILILDVLSRTCFLGCMVFALMLFVSFGILMVIYKHWCMFTSCISCIKAIVKKYSKVKKTVFGVTYG